MATRRYGISRGKSLAYNAVTEAVGAATAADQVELTFDLAAGLSKSDLIKALHAFEMQIVKSNWPPA